MRLFNVLLASLLVSNLWAQTPDYLDTLEVEIGDNAKVIFLAKDATGFEAIDRYDLNFVFAELWRRRQAGALGEVDLSKSEILDLQAGEKLVIALQNSEVKKTVLSRIHSQTFDTSKSLELFYLIEKEYPSAFVYCFSDPILGTWLGASPEILLKKEKDIFQTI